MLASRRGISLPPFWNPGSEDVVSTEGTPEITGDIRQSRPVQSSLAPPAAPLTSLSPIPLTLPPVAQLSLWKGGQLISPAPPIKPARPNIAEITTSLFHFILLGLCGPPRLPVRTQSVGQSVSPSVHRFPRQRVPSLSARWIPRSDITPGQSGPISGGFPQPCRACVRAHACKHGSSWTLQTLYHGAAEIASVDQLQTCPSPAYPAYPAHRDPKNNMKRGLA